MMQAPYFADFYLTSAFLKDMLDRDQGILLHVNSPAAFEAWKSSAGYVATRHALLGLHKALLQDLAGTGVKSCHVVFGHVDTPYISRHGLDKTSFPLLDRIVPVLSADRCAAELLKLAKTPKPWTIKPFMMWFFMHHARLFPRLTRWMMRF